MSTTDAIQEMLAEHGYVADRQVVMSVYLAQTLERPLLIEGPAGVGKTEVAKVVARALDTELIRLQCYEGLDAHAALYEWNYQRQLLHIKLDEKSQRSPSRARGRPLSPRTSCSSAPCSRPSPSPSRRCC